MRSAGRALARVSMVVLGLVVGVDASLPATAQGSAPAASRVVVVAIPALGFDDVRPADTPELVALADRGATAALSVKTIGRRTDRPGGYATLGAGARAVAPSGTSAAAIGGAGAAPIGVVGLTEVRRANAGTHQGAVVGALGTALHRAGWATAVVANHDGADGVDRSATLGVVRPRTDPEEGLIDLGTVRRDLTASGSGDRPRTDPGAVLAALDAVDAERPSGTVTLVEIGDVAWSEGAGDTEGERRAAVGRADALVGRIADRLDPSDVLVVLAPTAPAAQEQPTPFLLLGPDVAPGEARSATTRRAGFVTLTDVAPTILDRAGIPVPASMSGTPITSEASSNTGASRWAAQRAEIAEQRFVDRSAGIFLVTFPIVFACWSLLALLAAVLPLGRAAGPARSLVRGLGLALAVTPILTFLGGALTVGSWGQPTWSAVVWGLGGVVGFAAARLLRPGRAAVGVVAVTWSVLVADVLSGGALQFGTPLGNSPTVAGRFAGMGNIAFGLLAASGLVVSVAVWHAVGRSRPGRPALLAATAVLAVTVVVDGAPGLGADVGGVLTLVPVAALTLWALTGRGISWARAGVAAIGTLGVLAVLTAVDLTRPAADQTHLGRLARGLVGGDGTNDVVVRKAVAARDSFVASSLVWVVICTLLLVGLLHRFDRERIRAALRPPLARTLVTSAALLGLLGAALNDSGVMVPAMMASVLVPTAYHRYLAGPADGSPDHPRAAPASASTAGP